MGYSFHNEVEKLISNNDTKSAITTLLECLNEVCREYPKDETLEEYKAAVILNSSKFERNRHKELVHTISEQEKELNNNQVNLSILKLSRDSQKHVDKFNNHEGTSLPNSYENTQTIGLELTLNKDIDEFSEDELLNFINTIKFNLRINKELKIRNISEGSTKIKIQLPKEKAWLLNKLIEKGEIKGFQITKVEKEIQTKIRVFIGSTSESFQFSKSIRDSFQEDIFDVDVWSLDIIEGLNDNIFKNFTNIYDYVIILFSYDDYFYKSNDKTVLGNSIDSQFVSYFYYQIGMLTGKIGAQKTYFIFVSNQDSFSYFDKIMLNQTHNKVNSFIIDESSFNDNNTELSAINNRLSQSMISNYEEPDISFTPSTSLANGYFRFFVKKLIEGILEISKNETDFNSSLFESTGKTVKIIGAAHKIRIKIILPNLMEDRGEVFTKEFKNLEKVGIPSATGRLIMVYAKIYNDIEGNTLINIYDIPTTIYSVLESLNIVSNHISIKEVLFENEKRNFKKTIERLIKNSDLGEIDISVISQDEFKEDIKKL